MAKKNSIKNKIVANSEYWNKRAEANFLKQEEMQSQYETKIMTIYEQITKELESELSKTYSKYAKNNVMTNEEAYQSLSRSELAKYKSDVFNYIKTANSEASNPLYTQHLLNESLKTRVTVLDQLKTNWRTVVNKYTNVEEAENLLGKVYATTSLSSEFDIEKGLGIRLDFTSVNEDKIKAVLNESWADGNFYSRYYGDKEKLTTSLDDILTKGFATGQAYSKMAKDISKSTGASFNRSMTLVKTECARLDNQATLDNMYSIKTNKFQFSATLDSKTSDICSSMDGQVFDMKDAQIGLNVPPLHPNCRSTIIPYEDANDITERMERDITTGKSKLKQVDENYDYSDWAEEKYGKEVANKIRNNTLDIQDVVKSKSDNSNTMAKLIAGSNINLLGYNSHKEAVDNVRSREFTNIQAQNENYNDEYYNEQLAKVQELVEAKGNELTVRVKAVDLDKIAEDGRLKNIQQTDTSNGNNNPEWRKTIENSLFNIPLDAEDSLRPVYGYVSNQAVENGHRAFELQKYGNVKVVLRGEVKERSTITMGDSMNNSARVYPSRFNAIEKTSIRPEDLAYEKWEDLNFRGYPEVQVHNGVLISDIYKIEIPKEYKGSIDSYTLKKFKNNNIKIIYK